MKTAQDLKISKNKKKLAFLTCYDFTFAKTMDTCNLDAILVGDSLGEVLYGMDNTTFVTLEMMIQHTKAVKKGLCKTHLIADMPFNTYETKTEALSNAKKLIAGGANSVKLENPKSVVVEKLVANDIPVCGHIGLTPQTNQNYKKQGNDDLSKKQIIQDAKRLQQAGCYAMVLEAVNTHLAQKITSILQVPTIGIASGPYCDGQILVHYDLFGISPETLFKIKTRVSFVKMIKKTVNNFILNINLK